MAILEELSLTEKQSLSFKLEIENADPSQVEGSFVIRSEGFDISIPAVIGDGRLEANIPALSGILEADVYDCYIDIVVEGEKYFRPISEQVKFLKETKVSAEFETSTVAKRVDNTKVSVKVNSYPHRLPNVQDWARRWRTKYPNVESVVPDTKEEVIDILSEKIGESAKKFSVDFIEGTAGLWHAYLGEESYYVFTPARKLFE